MKNTIAYLILAATVIFNLWLYYPETQILADPNDNVFQYGLVGRTNWVWENYGCPLSPSCLPNLIDHNVTNWAEGYPLPLYYSHMPQIAIVSSYQLVIKPVSSILNSQFSLYNYYNWTKYLLLAFFPLSVFLALRIAGFSPVSAALGAFFSAHISTDGLYGIDPPSYLWRGYGLTSQLYAMIFLPLGIAFTYKALSCTSSVFPSPTLKSLKLPKSLRKNSFILAILFLTLTTMGHLGIGLIGFLSTLPFIFQDFNLSQIINKGKKLFLILASCFLILSYWIVPILLNGNYHIVSFWDPLWKFNSYGWYEVVRQLFNGEIFDWQRFPIITALTLMGFFVLAVKKNFRPFSLLFAFWFLLYFGRTTWGGLIDLIPGMQDFHQHRFIVGIHLAALFLIPAGLEYIFNLLRKISFITMVATDAKQAKQNAIFTDRIRNAWTRVMHTINYQPLRQTHGNNAVAETSHIAGKKSASASLLNQNIIFYITIFIFASLLVFFTAKQTVAYAQLNNQWIYQANDAYRYSEKDFNNLLARIDSSPSGRVYAGRPGNWGKEFRLGSTQLYLLFGGIGYNLSQFLPETWSPMSENEQNFDEREALDYDLLNIKYIVAPNPPAGEAGNEGFAPSLKLDNKFGPFEFYTASTSGWIDVVSSPMMVKSDKTNYVNLVHLWWNSYARRWKMHPIISVERNPIIPQGMQKIITMTDEVSYKESDKDTRGVAGIQGFPRGGGIGTNNIFSDFPFVFPESTVSAKIKNENVSRQTYSATVEVPNNCKNCMAMFKMSYHPDWQVKVDGQEASKYSVFPFYLATPVSPGTHTVEFTYQPNKLKVILLAGEIISAAVIILFRKKIRANK